MAYTGLKTFLYGILDEETMTYTPPEKLGGAIESKVTLNTNDAKLYEDDVLSDSDTSVSGGTITLSIGDDDDRIFSPLLGKKKTTMTVNEKQVDVYTSNADDIPKAVGFGYITGKNKGGYKVHFYPKVKFSPYSVDAKTKEEKTEYNTPSVEGTLFPLENGDYKREAMAEDIETATEVLKSFFIQPTESEGPEAP